MNTILKCVNTNLFKCHSQFLQTPGIQEFCPMVLGLPGQTHQSGHTLLCSYTHQAAVSRTMWKLHWFLTTSSWVNVKVLLFINLLNCFTLYCVVIFIYLKKYIYIEDAKSNLSFNLPNGFQCPNICSTARRRTCSTPVKVVHNALLPSTNSASSCLRKLVEFLSNTLGEKNRILFTETWQTNIILQQFSTAYLENKLPMPCAMHQTCA